MKLGVCVPYRNREPHLKEFIPTIGKYLEEQGIDKVSRVINGGDHGLIERRTKYQFALHIVNCN